MMPFHNGDRLAYCDCGASLNQRVNWLIACEYPAAVIDRKHSAVDNGAGIVHRAVGDRCHDRANRSSNIDSSVPRRPRLWRRLKMTGNVATGNGPRPLHILPGGSGSKH